MKNLVQLITLTLALAGLTLPAQASNEPSAVIECIEIGSVPMALLNMPDFELPQAFTAAPTCRAVEEADSFLGKAVESLTVVGSVTKACKGGRGAQIHAIVTTLTEAANVARVVVRNLPCEDKTEEEIYELMAQVTCDMFQATGISCNANRIPIR